MKRLAYLLPLLVGVTAAGIGAWAVLGRESPEQDEPIVGVVEYQDGSRFEITEKGRWVLEEVYDGPRRRPLNKREVAFNLREKVYLANVPLRNDPMHADGWQDVKGLFEGNRRFLCGGMGWVLYHMLPEVGIPARVVALATEYAASGRYPHDTHVAVEAYIDGRWIAVDPTFNASFRCAGRYRSFAELRECWRNDQPIRVVEGKLLPDRSIAEYKQEEGRRYLDHLYGLHYDPRQVAGRNETPPDQPHPGWYEQMLGNRE
jgi:hypothetical protein